MPFRYHPLVRAAILGRVAAGETVKAVCAEAGMPDQTSVNGWARRDAGFAAELAAARARGAARRLWDCDEAVAWALIRRLAAGARLAEVLREPGMPSWRTYRRWMGAEGWFGAEVRRLTGVKREMAAAGLRARHRAFDPAVADRLYRRLWRGEATLRAVLASEAEFPSRAVLARWRREQPEFDARLRFVFGAWRTRKAASGRPRPGRGMWSEALGEAVLAGIVAGGSLRSLGAQPGMPCAATLYAWVRDRPDFARAVAQACDDREQAYLDRMLTIAEAAGPGDVAAARRAIGRLSARLARLRRRPGAVGGWR